MAEPNFKNQTIWTGDCLDIMRGMNSECVDLICLDPPFNSNTNYAAPIGSEAAGAEFKDTWSLSDIDNEWIDLIEGQHPQLYRVILAAMTDSAKSYLAYMAVRLIEMRRILKPSGNIYLHCDSTMSHYLKLVMDAVFRTFEHGGGKFMNEVIWHYGKMSNASKKFPANHDTLLRYSKTDNPTFHPVKGAESEYKERFKKFLTGNFVLYGSVKHKSDKLIIKRAEKISKELGRPLVDTDVMYDFTKEFKAQSDVIYASIIKGNSRERTGYPTQKPLALYRKIIESSSNPNDIVLDPFCGCATTCIAAQDLGRQWIGIDISEKAVDLVKMRLYKELRLFANPTHRTDIPVRSDLGKLIPYNSTENKTWLYGNQGGYCAGCDTHFEPRHLEIDHIIARSKGGTDHISNLQLLCGSCNRIKGNRGMEYLRVKLQLAS